MRSWVDETEPCIPRWSDPLFSLDCILGGSAHSMRHKHLKLIFDMMQLCTNKKHWHKTLAESIALSSSKESSRLVPSEAMRSRSWASNRLCRSSSSSSRALHNVTVLIMNSKWSQSKRRWWLTESYEVAHNIPQKQQEKPFDQSGLGWQWKLLLSSEYLQALYCKHLIQACPVHLTGVIWGTHPVNECSIWLSGTSASHRIFKNECKSHYDDVFRWSTAEICRYERVIGV